jgi:hypothetical protein
MNDNFLEKLYETVILPNYPEINIEKIHWKDHGKVDLDAWAHYFDDEAGTEYLLLFEDYPSGSFLVDGLSHEVVKRVGSEDDSIHFSIDTPFKYIENVTGYFTLFKEKDRSSHRVGF